MDDSNYDVEDACTCRVSYYKTNNKIDKSKIDLKLADKYKHIAFQRCLHSFGNNLKQDAMSLKLTTVLLSKILLHLQENNDNNNNNDTVIINLGFIQHMIQQ